MEVADLCDAVTATAARTFGPWPPPGGSSTDRPSTDRPSTDQP